MRKILFLVGVMALGAAACGGSAKSENPTTAEKRSLYDRLGGEPAITAVIDDFLANVLADNRINAFFANVDEAGKANLRAKLIEQVCAASGGPCTYTGKDMVTVHTGMNLTEADFNALVEDLVKSLDKFKVPEPEKNELLAALGSMKGDIVGK